MTLSIGTSGYNEIQIILLIGTSKYKIRYTSEYIPKLQIHQKWEVVSMEFITVFPMTWRQHDSIMVVVEKLTKESHFIPVKST